MSSTGFAAAAMLLVGASVNACSCGSPDDANTTAQGGAGGGASGGGGPGTGGGDILTGSGGMGGGFEECAASEAEATLTSRPVDIIFVIDNSGSMSGEIYEVEAQINANFATIINAAVPPIDYRVIMVSRHGNYASQQICVSEPLSGAPASALGHCSPIPAQPVNTASFFHHSVTISSVNALCKLHEQLSVADVFNLQPTGYQEVLRPEAFKTFVVITDDRVSCAPYNDGNTENGGVAAAAAWDAATLALSPEQFGTAQERNYVFHSIIGLAPYDMADLTLPHPPDAPIVCNANPGSTCTTAARCSPGSVNPGTGYQALSKLTGGLRYPSCGLNYTSIFQKIAEGVIDGAQISCEFAIPEPPPGETLDLETVVVVYTPGDGGAAETFYKVPGLASCAPERFYIDGDTIILCPDACSQVQADEAAQIRVKFGCTVDVPQ